jgi:hypothetical protein
MFTKKTHNMPKHANKLISETSPYLLQHAHNPVEWHAWNSKTLEKAKKEDRMMLVSIGYSACHWCHVMEHESFENEEIAQMMNENFICVKVDREERPDVDAIYMNAVQLIHGHGGWPLNCFTLPDGKPFYGGTYFQPEQWKGLLENIAKLFALQRNDIEKQAQQVTDGLKDDLMLKPQNKEESINSNTILQAYQKLEKQLDTINGGFKGAPKFPLPNSLSFLLRYYHHSENADLESYLKQSFDKMAAGGIYDHIGGGFSRYSVDEKWHVPHFEKMLYDNAQLISLYGEAFILFKDDNYLCIAEETAQFVLRELTSPEGLFYSALDADSEGEEGKFYVWTKNDFSEILGDNAKLIGDYFGIDKEAWWEGEKNVLVKTASGEGFANDNHLGLVEFEDKLKKSKTILLNERDKRTRPGLDDKSLTSWNAMMIKAYIDLYNASGKNTYLDTAITATEFILANLSNKKGGLYHSYKKGNAKIDAFLEDYAFLIEALIELYQATFNEKWLTKAEELLTYTFSNFFDEADGFFWFTNKRSHDLVARKKEIHDSVMPSSNSSLANSLFKLGLFLDKQNYIDISKNMLLALSDQFTKHPSSFTNWLNLALLSTDPFVEVAFTGPNIELLRKEFVQHYIPSKIIAGSNTKSELPLLQHRYIKGKDMIYVCSDKTCKHPVESVGEAIAQINHPKNPSTISGKMKKH